MNNVELIATAAFGLEAVVAQELKDLGFSDLNVENGKVTFRTDAAGMCRANLWLRTADRIRLKIGEFQATTFEELFEKTKALPWAEWVPENARFPVEGKSVKSTLFSVSDCQAIVKKAVVESLKKTYRKSWFEETGALYKIEVALLKDTATLTIDTSGPGLHKRGYRDWIGQAPLKETLAAAMIMLARWKPDIPLIDPFCGSGTIPIEAALIGKNIAPGLNRSFTFESWPNIPKKVRDAVREEARERMRDEPLEIIGTDVDDRVIKTARRNASEAGVAEHIHLQRLPFRDIRSKKKYGKLICNPPYGQRIGEKRELAALYQEMRDRLEELDTWSYYILTADERFEKLFGRRATKKRKLYNGTIKVHYYQYFGPRPPKKRPQEDEA